MTKFIIPMNNHNLYNNSTKNKLTIKWNNNRSMKTKDRTCNKIL
jgi:hypothetical protein